MLGAVRYDLRAEQLTETQIGLGYIDDCLILALNYITEFNYNATQKHNHSLMLQLSLRTLGGNSVSTRVLRSVRVSQGPRGSSRRPVATGLVTQARLR